MRAKVLKIDKKLFDGEIVKVVVPAESGELCVLPHHMQMITSMREGDIRVYAPNVDRPTTIHTKGGIFAFSENTATVLV